MAITQGLCSQFKQDILLGVHDLAVDTLKIALYSNAASIGPNTTAYTTDGEVTGVGYLAGGQSLTGVSVSLTDTVAFVDFANPSWLGVSITARGALIYNYSKSNKAIAVLDFGTDKTANDTTFELVMPVNNSNTALIRIA
jgi:hypothetical protein